MARSACDGRPRASTQVACSRRYSSGRRGQDPSPPPHDTEQQYGNIWKPAEHLLLGVGGLGTGFAVEACRMRQNLFHLLGLGDYIIREPPNNLTLPGISVFFLRAV